MRFYRNLHGGPPLVMDVPVYDASALAAGELIMRGGHGGTTNSYYITAYTGSSSTEAADSLGVLQESVTSPTVVASAGFNYAKCIVSPWVTYLAEYFQTSGNVIDVTSASTSTTLTTTSLEDNIDGGWVYFTNKTTSTATAAGELRYLTAAASGSCTMDSAVTVDTTSDFIKIFPLSHLLILLSTDALGLMSAAASTNSASNAMVLENYISNSGLLKPLRYASHKGSYNDPETTKFYAELVLLDHVFIKG